MKKRNKHYLKDKEFIRLQRELRKNWESQSNLGWIDLPNPEFIGYNAYLEPRADIQNREDAWVFWYICQNFGTKSFAKNISDFDWNRFGKKVYKYRRYEKPRIEGISKYGYDNIPPQVRRWFTDNVAIDYGWIKFRGYYCHVPDFFFEIKYEKEFKTRVKLYSPILEQEEAEIESTLYTKFYKKHRVKRWSKAPKHFRKSLNRSQRSKSKQTLYNIVYNKKEIEFSDNYRGADWLWD